MCKNTQKQAKMPKIAQKNVKLIKNRVLKPKISTAIKISIGGAASATTFFYICVCTLSSISPAFPLSPTLAHPVDSPKY